MPKFSPAAILLKIFYCSPLFAALDSVDKINDSTAPHRVRPSNKRVADKFLQAWAHFSILLAFLVCSTVASAGSVSLFYGSVDEMLHDNAVGYSDLSPGDIVQVGTWSYSVTAPSAGDAHLLTDNGVGLYALPGSDGALHTSQFGWQSGDDISQEFTDLVETSLGANSHIIFDDVYSISGSNIDLPDGIVLEGAAGSGLTVTGITAATNLLFRIGSDSEILDMKFVADGPDELHQHYRLFEARDADNILISGSHFQGNIGIFVDLHRGSNFLSENNVFEGGMIQMRWLGLSDGYTVDNTAFIGSDGDGIKTSAGVSGGTIQATISNSLFAENGRDGIDTAGGFKDSTVLDSIFVGNGVSGIDLKTIIDDPSDFNSDLMNENILVIGSQFIDNQNGIVFTTLDRLDNPMDENTASQWAVQNVYIQDTIFEINGSAFKNAFLFKDAHDISWDNIQLLGNVREFGQAPAYDWNMPYAIGGTGVTTDVARGDFDWQALLDTFGPMVDSGNGSTPIDPPEDATEISVDDSSDSGSGIFDAFMGFFKSILGFFLNLFSVDSGGGIDELLDAIQADTMGENVAPNDQLSLSESDVAALFLETTISIGDQFHDEVAENSELFEQFA